jgi:hypothetical protein
MAQHNTDYGLVYDDEGKICVTKRTDIIPFSGVTSYAVETATTNYLAPHAWEFDSEQTLFYPSGLAEGKTWADCWDEKQKAYVGGQGLTCWNIETRSIDLGSVQAAGTKITLSWKHKGYLWYIVLYHSLDNTTFTSWNSADTLEFKGDSSLRNISDGLYINIDGKSTDRYGQPEQLLDRWYNVEITYTLPSDTRYIKLTWNFFEADQANGGLGVLGYIRQPQLEIKPFASSFVNGSRPNGRLVVPLEKLGFNPATDDWVVHYWKYPVATDTNDLTGYNLCSIGRWASDNLEGYIWWGKEIGSNVFKIYLVYNDSTFASVTSPSFDPAWYFRNWHHEVLLKHGSEMQYWIDGTLQVQLALAKPLLNNFVVGLTLGGYATAPANNSYIANLCYGKYTDQWTPEFIQEIYQQRNGFFVPPKAVIV